MPPKKTEGATKAKAPASHPTYQDMIAEAITQLKDRNGSSRQSLKKYVKANNNIQAQTDSMFDSLFNRALKAGVDKGVFVQPKGASGGTKLAKKSAPVKKEAAPKEKKPAAEKKETAKKVTAKKPAAKKEGAAATKKAAPKKAASTAAPKKAAPKKKADAAAPAVVDKPATLTKTKSGRVAKTTKPAAKKAATTKKPAAAKKEKTPKKAAASTAAASTA
ncbi:putative histone h1 [Diaporthe ampelina]|uniref:Histone H1 n=1 Tax=Diaporthe ampelina TaxID=1214573 RepID=A0A0G2FBL6_9PEZI|nr:putative histone h1 [Diaporthe ampelina]